MDIAGSGRRLKAAALPVKALRRMEYGGSSEKKRG
jgi:hypothetical protein